MKKQMPSKMNFRPISISAAGLALGLIAMALPSTALAVDSTWTGLGDGLWSSAGNWNPSTAPVGAGDIARVTSGLVMVDGPIALDKLYQSGGELQSVGDPLLYSLEIANGIHFEGANLQVGVLRDMYISVHGNSTWNPTAEDAYCVGADNGFIYLQDGATFNIQKDSRFGFYTTTSAVFFNEGTTSKTAGSGRFDFTWEFINSGQLLVSSGQISLSGGSLSAGDFTALGGDIVFAAGTHQLLENAAFTTGNGGRIRLTGGTLSLGDLSADGPNAGTGEFHFEAGSIEATDPEFEELDPITMHVGAASFRGNVQHSSGEVKAGSVSFFSQTGAGGLLGSFSGTSIVTNTGNGFWNTDSGESYIQGSDTAQFRNSGVFDVQTPVENGYGFAYAVTGAPAIVNSGTFKRTGTGTFDIGWAFNHQSGGTVSAEGGGLRLMGGGTSAGAFTASNGAYVEFGSGNFVLGDGTTFSGGTFAAPGAKLTGATLQVDGLVGGVPSYGSLEMSGGTVQGEGTLAISRLRFLGNSTITDTTLTAGIGVEFFNPEEVPKLLGTFTGTSTVVNGWLGGRWNSASLETYVQGGDSAAFINEGAFFIETPVQPGYGFVSTGGGSPTFKNHGQVHRMGSGVFEIGWAFENVGNSAAVYASEGVLKLLGGGVSTGVFVADDEANVEFGAGTFLLGAGTRFSGGTFEHPGFRLTGATLQLDAVLTGAVYDDDGCFEFSSGAITGTGELRISRLKCVGNVAVSSGTVLADQGVQFTGDDPAQLGSLSGTGRLVNAGPGGQWNTNSTYTYIDGTGSGVFENRGTFDVQTPVEAGYGFINSGGSPLVLNSGTFRRSGTGTFDIGWDFANTGTLEIAGGTLHLGGTFSQSSGLTKVAGTLSSSLPLTFNGGGLRGTGMVNADVAVSGAATEVSPGPAIGILQVGGTYGQNDGKLTMGLRRTGGVLSSHSLHVTGDVTLADTDVVLENALPGDALQMGDIFTILTTDGTLSSTNVHVLAGASLAGYSFGAIVSANSYQVQVTGIPEPDTASEIIAAAGLVGPDAALDAIPYDDGVSNLLKVAFNMNLNGPDSHPMSEGGNSGLPFSRLIKVGNQYYWRFQFVRRVNDAVNYEAQKSPTMAPGSFVPMMGTEIIQNIDSTWERVTIDAPLNLLTDPSYFFRIQITGV